MMYSFEVYNSDWLLEDLLSIESSTPTHHKTMTTDDVYAIITAAMDSIGGDASAIYQWT